MTCENRDQDLLLLAHGELPLSRRLRVRIHLRRCTACQQRYQRWLSASTALAAVLHKPGAQGWSPALTQSPFVLRRPALLLLLLLSLISLFLCRVIYMAVTPGPDVTQRLNSTQTPGCAPGLANDHCQ